MIMSALTGRTTVVGSASRGLGRGITGAVAEAGTAAVARSRPALAELAATSASIRIKVADRIRARQSGL
jgi:NAD(P)-dependent dehydrogenase (short-subunit alcohol dehydrogenase family)